MPHRPNRRAEPRVTLTEALKLIELVIWAAAGLLAAAGVLLKRYDRRPSPEMPIALLAMVCILIAVWQLRSLFVGNANPARGFALNSWFSIEGFSIALAASCCVWDWCWNFRKGDGCD